MKIGIITFNSAHNYGAVLQAWATQTYLEKQGHQVEVINLRLPAIDNVYKIAVNKKYVNNKYANVILNKARVIKRCISDLEKYKRYRTFERFINRKLHVTKMYQCSQELKEDTSLKYDVLIAGSDQIWNSSLTKLLEGAYFLDFGGKDTKRISYAASIGRKELPQNEIELVRHYLQELDYISVREVNAYKAIEPLTSKEVEIVADPTFLLERADFDKLKQPFPVKQPYIYVHNVHLAKKDMRLFEVAEELSKRTGLPIVTNRKDEQYSNVVGRFTSGKPEQFIGVISEAEYVVTNSFHATVFALIYHRNFITIPHITNPDRMQNLLGELGIANHLIASKKRVPEDLSELDIDYDEVESRKSKMRKTSVAFLEKAIRGPKVEGAKTKLHGVSITERMENEQSMKEIYLASPVRKHVYQEQILCDALVPMMELIKKKGGKFAFPVYDANMKLTYTMTDDIRMLERAAVPEMFETDMNGILEEIKRLLTDDLQVMFVGSACRILELRQYLGKDYENLLAVEVLGHGECDEEIYAGYVKHLEAVYKSRLVRLELNNNFRKPNETFTVATFESGAVKVESNIREPLNWAYKRNYIQKLPCYFCRVRGGAQGAADIILGSGTEYKEVQENSKYQVFYTENESVVLSVVSDRGHNVWQSIATEYDILELNMEDCGLKSLAMTQKRLTGMELLQSENDVYEGLLQLKKPKKRK